MRELLVEAFRVAVVARRHDRHDVAGQAVQDHAGALRVGVPQPLPVLLARGRELALRDGLGDDLVTLVDPAAGLGGLEPLDAVLLPHPTPRCR